MALPKFRGLVADDVLVWCANELQGYSGGLEFYQNKNHDLPEYRVVTGRLRVVSADGNFSEINHPLAQRNQYFLSAPLGWLEDFFGLPGDQAIADLPELTNYIGRHVGGTIVCECPRTDLKRILDQFQIKFVSIIEEVADKKQARSGSQAGFWGAAHDTGFSQAPAWVPDAPEKEYEIPPGYVPPEMPAPFVPPAFVPPTNESPEPAQAYEPSALDSLSGYIPPAEQAAQPQKKFIGGTGGGATAPKAPAEPRAAGRLRGMESQLDPEQLKKEKKEAEKQAKAAAKAQQSTSGGPSGWAPPIPVSDQLAKSAGVLPNLLESVEQAPISPAPPPQPVVSPPPPPQPVTQQNAAAWTPPVPQAPPPQPATPAAWSPPVPTPPAPAPAAKWTPPGQPAAPARATSMDAARCI